jgi:hypothetical protein
MRIPSLFRRQECRPGALFYRCQVTPFVGCCSVNPCDPLGCPDGSDATAVLSPKATPMTTYIITKAGPVETGFPLTSEVIAATEPVVAVEATETASSPTIPQATSVASPVLPSSSSSASQNTGTILTPAAMGGIGAALVCLLIIISVLTILYIRKGKQLTESIATLVSRAEGPAKDPATFMDMPPTPAALTSRPKSKAEMFSYYNGGES